MCNIQKVISITTLSFSSAEKSFPKHHKYHRVNVPLGMRENRNLGCILCNIVKSCISNLQTYHEQKYLSQNSMRPKKLLSGELGLIRHRAIICKVFPKIACALSRRTMKVFNIFWTGSGKNAIMVLCCTAWQAHEYQGIKLSLSENTFFKIACDLNKCTIKNVMWFTGDQGRTTLEVLWLYHLLSISRI